MVHVARVKVVVYSITQSCMTFRSSNPGRFVALRLIDRTAQNAVSRTLKLMAEKAAGGEEDLSKSS